MSEVFDLAARGLWERDGRPWQERLANHALAEGMEVKVRYPLLPPEDGNE